MRPETPLNRVTPPVLGDWAVDVGPASPSGGITVVSGPAGCGKSTLLARWYRDLVAAGCTPAWLTIDARDRDTSTVKRLIESSVVHHGHTELASLVPGGVLAAVAPANRILFLDGVDLLDQRVLDDLWIGFGRVPGPPWRLILAGRSAPLLPDTRKSEQRVQKVQYVGPDDLRFDDDQVAQCLRHQVPALKPEQLDALVARIGGWAGGIALVFEAEPPNGLHSQALSGHDPRVGDYFEREVLSGLSLSDQDFLIWISVLSKPTAGDCDEIVAEKRSTERLARLGSLNAFLGPDPDGEGYRWFPLGRDYLLDRLRSLGPATEREVRRRALRRYLARREYSGAVEQAARTQEWYTITDIGLDAGLQIISAGRAGSLSQWLDRLPGEIRAQESGLAVVAAMALWVDEGDEASDRIERWLTEAAAVKQGRPPPDTESLSSAIETAQAAFGLHAPRIRKLYAERALHVHKGPDTAWTALSYSAIGLASYLNAKPREARRALARSLDIQTSLDLESRRWVSRLFSPFALAILALIELESGRNSTRGAALVSAAELQSQLRNPPGSEIVTLARSRQALTNGDRDAAVDLALKSAAEARLLAFRALAWLDAASIYCEMGKADESSACLAEANRVFARFPDCGPLLSKRRRAIERQVQLGRAARWSDVGLLTERELEVLRLLDTELSRREIAAELYLSFETVKTYVQRLYHKLGVSSRESAVATARAWGWLEPLDPGGEIDAPATAGNAGGVPPGEGGPGRGAAKAQHAQSMDSSTNRPGRPT